MSKPMIQALNGEKIQHIPWWLMRQAGRYLPEYREIRKDLGSFLNLVYNDEMASEITMQPVRRYGMNGAILFSDILVIPHAMGQDVQFISGQGPVLKPLQNRADLEILNPEKIDEILNPVYKTVQHTAQKLKDEQYHQTNLIGFAGAPWTVACYMVEGRGSRDFHAAKHFALNDPDGFNALMGLITQSTIHYLLKQIESGAEILQLFDSWAGILDDDLTQKYVIEPTIKIVQALKQHHPHVPVIGFPRGAGVMLKTYIDQTKVDGIGIDYTVPSDWARDHLQKNGICVQGNLDPVYLLGDQKQLEKKLDQILKDLSSGPFIFNLGHGVIKETKPETITVIKNIIENFEI